MQISIPLAGCYFFRTCGAVVYYQKSRRVPGNSFLYSELMSLVGEKKIKDHETIFQTSNRQPISHDNFAKRAFAKDLEEWGGKKIRFHNMRHTAMTLMIGGGVDLKTVQEICGHDNTKTTMNYVHLLSERIKETARTFSVLPASTSNQPAPSASNVIPFRSCSLS